MDAAWFRRVYGPDPDEPAAGQRPDRSYVELVGGPLDGMLLDATGWDPQEFADHTVLISEHSPFGPVEDPYYAPAEGHEGAVGRFV
ncbi:hypothetical protein [Streptomyces sp. NPDC001389]|uniref:hypothetical protein n=1 Tax=Streptomyces sp. NPDC001389 TaxID=3364569 RepID=UPI0036B254BF